MNWQTTREQWNRDGQCAREACRASLDNDDETVFVHSHSHLKYCCRCAELINRANNQQLVVAVKI